MNKIWLLAVFAANLLLFLTGCVQCGTGPTSNSCEENTVAAAPGGTAAVPPPPAPFRISSADFADGSAIPRILACVKKGGQNLSPQLAWANAPSTAVSFAIIMDDETPPFCGSGDGACIHWGVFNIPSASVLGLTQGMELSSIFGVVLGKTYAGNAAYDGPCPPSAHTYKITIFALNATMPPLSAPVGLMTRGKFESSYIAYILDQATLTGTFTP